MSRRGSGSTVSRNDPAGDTGDLAEPDAYSRSYEYADPVLAERFARRRRAVVAAMVAVVTLGGAGGVRLPGISWPF